MNQRYEFADGSVMYGAAGYRKTTMTRLGWAWCVMFNSNLFYIHRDLQKLPRAVLRVLAVLPMTIPAAFVRDPMRFVWNLTTLPFFLLLVPFAALASYYNRRDVFPMAYQWTHGLLAFGHRWGPNKDCWPKIYDFCRVCGAYRRKERPPGSAHN